MKNAFLSSVGAACVAADETLASVTVALLSLDKIVTDRSDKLGPMIGRVDSDTMLRVNPGVALWLGLA